MDLVGLLKIFGNDNGWLTADLKCVKVGADLGGRWVIISKTHLIDALPFTNIVSFIQKGIQKELSQSKSGEKYYPEELYKKISKITPLILNDYQIYLG